MEQNETKKSREDKLAERKAMREGKTLKKTDDKEEDMGDHKALVKEKEDIKKA